MPTLAQQIIPRRKLLLIASETLILTAILFLGTSLPPLSSRTFVLHPFEHDCLRGILSCLTIAVLCQASLSYNDLVRNQRSGRRSRRLGAPRAGTPRDGTLPIPGVQE